MSRLLTCFVACCPRSLKLHCAIVVVVFDNAKENSIPISRLMDCSALALLSSSRKIQIDNASNLGVPFAPDIGAPFASTNRGSPYHPSPDATSSTNAFAEQLVVSSGCKTSIGSGSSRFGADYSSSQKQNRLHHVDDEYYATLLAVRSMDTTWMYMNGLLVIVAFCVAAQYMGRTCISALHKSRRTMSSGCLITFVWRPGKEQQPTVLRRRRTSMRQFHKRALIAALPFFVALLQPELVASGVSASGDSAGSIGSITASDPNDPNASTDDREVAGKGEGVFSALSGFMQRASHQLYGDTDEGLGGTDPGERHDQQSKSAAVAVGGDTHTQTGGSTSHATEVSEADAK